MDVDYIRPDSLKLEESELEKVKNALPNVLKNCTEVLSAADSFESAIHVLGKTVVGNALSEVSLTQCCGLVGMILSTLAPEVINALNHMKRLV